MSRTIKEIYDQAVAERDRRLELREFNSDSKLSILNGILWVTAAVIYTFEVLLDTFAMDISEVINSRINGTPAYYVRALLQYQKGDELAVREDGLAFGYASVDESKRLVTQATYTESVEDDNLDAKLILKVATGEKGRLQPVGAEDLVLLNAYIARLKFAGTRVEVTSRKGDVLIPRVTVYYDGAVRESAALDGIEAKLNEYMSSVDFDAAIYVSKVVAAMRAAEHVTDVYIDTAAVPAQGIFVASYDVDGCLTGTRRVERVLHTASGYLTQSAGTQEQCELPTFREALTLKVESHEV
uniref:hypothetical protein n=1 Tax=Alistipes sp. D31t1_170403_E11 TaxID=2787128 RepID=UPI001896D64D|nr:hypothetical protein [Alistipes sp. D31t1_170403_E11]